MTAPIQRRITLIRHAKAADDGQPDHERPLDAAGRAEAAALAERLHADRAVPELFVCSSSRRTRETLAAFGAHVPTLLTDRAYLASAGELLALLQEMDDAVQHIGLIAHNPGLHELAAMLAGEYRQSVDEERLMRMFPTAACAVFTFTIAHWNDLRSLQGTLERYAA